MSPTVSVLQPQDIDELLDYKYPVFFNFCKVNSQDLHPNLEVHCSHTLPRVARPSSVRGADRPILSAPRMLKVWPREAISHCSTLSTTHILHRIQEEVTASVANCNRLLTSTTITSSTHTNTTNRCDVRSLATMTDV